MQESVIFYTGRQSLPLKTRSRRCAVTVQYLGDRSSHQAKYENGHERVHCGQEILDFGTNSEAYSVINSNWNIPSGYLKCFSLVSRHYESGKTQVKSVRSVLHK